MYHQKPLLGELPDYPHPLTPTAAWIMNEGSGNKIYDIINGNHGTFGAGVSAPSWVPGGLDFDGGDNINCGNTRISDAITIIMLGANPDANDNRLLHYAASAITHFSFAFYYWAIGPKFILVAQKVAANIAMTVGEYTNTSAIGDSHDLAVTSDGTTVKAYMDGILQNAGTHGSTSNLGTTDTMYIGMRAAGDQHFDGSIKGLYIYDFVLQPSQIFQIYCEPYCWMAEPMEAELMYAAPPVGLSIPVAYHHYEALRVC